MTQPGSGTPLPCLQTIVLLRKPYGRIAWPVAFRGLRLRLNTTKGMRCPFVCPL